MRQFLRNTLRGVGSWKNSSPSKRAMLPQIVPAVAFFAVGELGCVKQGPSLQRAGFLLVLLKPKVSLVLTTAPNEPQPTSQHTKRVLLSPLDKIHSGRTSKQIQQLGSISFQKQPLFPGFGCVCRQSPALGMGDTHSRAPDVWSISPGLPQSVRAAVPSAGTKMTGRGGGWQESPLPFPANPWSLEPHIDPIDFLSLHTARAPVGPRGLGARGCKGRATGRQWELEMLELLVSEHQWFPDPGGCLSGSSLSFQGWSSPKGRFKRNMATKPFSFHGNAGGELDPSSWWF